MIRLGFYGASGEVTGSCFTVTTERARVMVDMGLLQGERGADERNRRMPPLDVSSIDAVVLTHAHLDHCGRLPLLTRQGSRARIHCTEPTVGVAGVILRDSAGIQAEDCERYNRRLRRGQEPCVEPLYDIRDVEQTLERFTPIRYGEERAIAEGVRVRFLDAGHILGSASVQMTVRDGERELTIVFSGDVGVSGSPILRDPMTPSPADVVLLESTYGDRDHKPLDRTLDEFLDILLEARRTGGKVLIPAFAVGRTQDIVYHLGEFVRAGKLEGLRAFVDSPMASSVTALYAAHPDVYDARARGLLAEAMSPLTFPGLSYTRTVQESKRLNGVEGWMVIIASSGMCAGGRILHHLYNHAAEPETQIVITGFQARGTLGRELVEGSRRVSIFREEIPVRARVHTLGGFSAHAGQTGLLAWMRPFEDSKPRVFLTHGEDAPRLALRGALNYKLGLRAELPVYGDEFEL